MFRQLTADEAKYYGHWWFVLFHIGWFEIIISKNYKY